MTLTPEEQAAFVLEAERAFLERGSRAHYEDALYYQHTYRRRSADVRWYRDYCLAAGGPVLELGCGAGRVTLALAKAGLEVTGVDAMRPMLEEGARRAEKLSAAARGRVTWVEGDLQALKIGQRFPTVVAPFNVFMHVYSLAEIAGAFDTVKRHLAPGGAFVFDVLMPDPSVLARDPQRRYKGRPVRHPRGSQYTYYESFDYDALTQVLAVTIEMQNVDDPSDVRVHPLTQRQFFPMELAALLDHAGLEVVERYGDFDGEPLRDYSDSQVYVCRARADSGA